MDKKDSIRVRTSSVFKIKNKIGKYYHAMNLYREFGFLPESIIIESVPGLKNTFVVRAVLSKEEAEKEDAMLASK